MNDTAQVNANLPSNFEELLKNYSSLQKELESVNQALYDCRRQVKTAEAIEKEYQEEIRILQNEGNVENRKLEAKIHSLEETNLNLKVSFHDRVSYLEKELSNKDDEIGQLKREMEVIIKISEKQPAHDETILIEELSELREQNAELLVKIGELETSCETYSNQNQEFQDKILDLQLEIENLKESLECKKEQIEENNALIQTLKDDYFSIKSELDSVKSKPLDDKSQGNSLFAEVNDRRLQLQQNMHLMKTRYQEMKREHSSLLKQISTLRNENKLLTAKFEAEITEKRRDEETIIESYKNQITILNEVIDSYKKEIKESAEMPEKCGYKQIEGIINLKNEEIEDLRQKLTARSINQTLLSHDVASEKRENRKLNLEIIKLQNEIGQLKVQLEELKIKSPTEETPSPIIPDSTTKSILKPANVTDITDFEIVNKENEQQNKVKFSEDIPEKTSSGPPKRRGAKLLISKPVQISNADNIK